MRLKYYLRGLGIGVAVTVLVLWGAPGKKETMTDAQIKARAAELGMVERSGVLSELAEETETGEEAGTETEADRQTVQAASETSENIQKKENQAEDRKAEKQAEAGDELKKEKETGEKPEEGPSEKEKEDEDGQETEEKPAVVEETIMTVAVYPGEGSYTVSKKLAASGLVESADIYDKYLCQNGYDKKLCSGNYEIPVGASPEEIAKILTKQQ